MSGIEIALPETELPDRIEMRQGALAGKAALEGH
jgi:hypothetical protein